MNNILSILVFTAAAVSILCMIFFVIVWIRVNMKKSDTQTSCMCSDRMIKHLDHIIESSVISTNQTLVNSLKKSDSFYQLDKEEAFVRTRNRILQSINMDVLKNSCTYINDIDEWINCRIEYHVRQNKV